MLKPVGTLPAAVYWRRRLVLLALLVVLVIVLAVLIGGGGNGKPAAAGAHRTTSSPTAVSSGRQATTPTTPSAPSSTPVVACPSSWLSVTAATGKASYVVSTTPDLYLVVVNPRPRPCTVDLADKQVVLTVSTGNVRVWGSHDCAVQPGTSVRTLVPKQPVRVKIVWTGTTSVPGCKSQRLVAQAGAYSLTASLSGKPSRPIRFAITGTTTGISTTTGI